MRTDELYKAVDENNIYSVKKILKEQPRLLNFPFKENGLTPICFAVKKGHCEIVSYLLENFSDVEISGGRNILFFAMKSESVEKTNILLNYLWDKFPKFTDGTSKAHLAAALGKVDYFNENMDKLGCETTLGVTPIFYALVMRKGSVLTLNNNIDIDFIKLSQASSFDQFSEEWRAIVEMVYWVADILSVLEVCYGDALFYSQFGVNQLSSIEKSDMSLDDRRLLAKFYKIHGHICLEFGNCLKAKKYFNEMVNLLNEISDDLKNVDDWILLRETLLALASSYYELGNFLESKKICRAWIENLYLKIQDESSQMTLMICYDLWCNSLEKKTPIHFILKTAVEVFSSDHDSKINVVKNLEEACQFFLESIDQDGRLILAKLMQHIVENYRAGTLPNQKLKAYFDNAPEKLQEFGCYLEKLREVPKLSTILQNDFSLPVAVVRRLKEQESKIGVLEQQNAELEKRLERLEGMLLGKRERDEPSLERKKARLF